MVIDLTWITYDNYYDKYPEIKESLNNFRQSLKDKVKKAAEKHNK